MKLTSLAKILFAGGAVAISSCAKTAIQSSYQLKKQMAKSIAREEGLTTVWNVAEPLKVGAIYKLTGTPERGYVLQYHYPRFEQQAAAMTFNQPVNTNWSQTVDRKSDVKAQLSYMGVKASPGWETTKKITFSAAGDAYSGFSDGEKLKELLNRSGTGIDLRKAVQSDTLARASRKAPPTEAKYWIVTRLMTVKDLSVGRTTSSSVSTKFETVDADVLAKFLNVKELKPVSLSGEQGRSSEAALKSPQSLGLIAKCVPLEATKERGQIVMDVNDDYGLDAANTRK